MFKIIPIALLLFSLTQSTIPASESAQRVNRPRNSSADARAIPSLRYCVLLEHQKVHIGKLVRLDATWQFGFETTFLRDRECPQQPGAWLEFADEKELCPETKKNRSAPGQSDKEADVTVLGRLYGPGRYGHLGDYQFKFVAACLEKIKVTSSDLK
jgi:hypothetical protein